MQSATDSVDGKVSRVHDETHDVNGPCHDASTIGAGRPKSRSIAGDARVQLAAMQQFFSDLRFVEHSHTAWATGYW
jgi:hypothetical protein